MYSRNNKVDDINGSFDLFEFSLVLISIVSTFPLRALEAMFSLIYSAIGYISLLDLKENKLSKNEKGLNWSYITEGKKMKNRRDKDSTISVDLEEIQLAKMLEDIKKKVAGVDENVVEVNFFTQDVVENNHEDEVIDVIGNFTHTSDEPHEKSKPAYERELEAALKDIQLYAKKDLS